MKLLCDEDVRETLRKIEVLEHHFQQTKLGSTELSDDGRELSMASLRRTINQMKEDITRFQSRREAAR